MENTFRLAFEQAPDATIIVDRRGVITHANDACATLFGWPAADLVGEAVDVLIPARVSNHSARIASFFSDPVRRPMGSGLRLEGQRRDGSTVPVSISLSPIEVDGETHAVASVRDVTATVRAQEELSDALHAAGEASRAKSLFLASMSHEIRTPLNAILGFAQLMSQDASLAASHRAQVQTIMTSGDHLLGLINDILEMSKIEAGGATVSASTFDPHALLTEVIRMMSVRSTEKSLSLDITIDDSLPELVKTDEAKLRQIVINLVGNALKFTVEGGVSVHARATGAEDDTDAVDLVVAVTDTGPGILDDEADLVFEAFGQAEEGRMTAGGTGLGLPISREFARLLGGDLTFTSKVDDPAIMFSMEPRMRVVATWAWTLPFSSTPTTSTV